MPRISPVFSMKSYGLYTEWDKESKSLPKIIRHTTEIPVDLGVEFGFILSVKKGKGIMLEYKIEHPSFKDDNGEIAPPFEGVYYVNSNDFEFFLGDTVWEPVEDKAGLWSLSVMYNGKIVAEKTFNLFIR